MEPEKKAPAGKAAAQETENTFREKEDEVLDRLDDVYDKRISAGSRELQEIALGNLKEQKEKHRREIGEIFARRRAELEKMKEKRDAEVKKLLGSAEEEAQKKITQIEGLLDISKGGKTYMDDNAVHKFLAEVKSVEKLAKEDARAEAIGNKLAQKQELSDEDYRYVASILKPYDIMANITESAGTLSATNAVVLVGFMRPEQRAKLMEAYFDSPNKGNSAQILDAFIRTKVLTEPHLSRLLESARRKNSVTEGEYADINGKIANGYYAEQIKQYEDEVKKQLAKIPSGNYANGTMDRVFGRPLLGGVLAIWGALVTGLNIAANWNDKKSWAKNPYIYMGAAAMLGGTEIATGTMKQGAPWFGSGWLGRGVDSLSETSQDKDDKLKTHSRQLIADIMDPLKAPASPPELIEYLRDGGYETVLALYRKKLEEGIRPKGGETLFTLEELMEMEKDNSVQWPRLQSLTKKNKDVQKSVLSKLVTVAEAGSRVLGMEKNSEFAKLLEELKSGQGGTEVASTAAAPSATQAAPDLSLAPPMGETGAPVEAPPVAESKPPVEAAEPAAAEPAQAPPAIAGPSQESAEPPVNPAS